MGRAIETDHRLDGHDKRLDLLEDMVEDLIRKVNDKYKVKKSTKVEKSNAEA